MKCGDHVPSTESTDTEAMKTIKLRDITTQLNDCVAALDHASWIMARWRILLIPEVYTTAKYPLLIDPTGQACQFLKYRGPVP